MPSGERFVEGLPELTRKLRELDRKTGMRALVRATKAAAEPIRTDAERRAPRSDTPGGSRGKGHAADHVIAKVKRRRKNEVEVGVGPDADHWYLSFAEFGGGGPHEVRSRTKKAVKTEAGIFRVVRHPGHAAQPFLRPAFDSQKDDAVREFVRVLGSEITRMAK